MVPIHNEGGSLIAKSFTRTLRHMTVVSENVYNNKVDYIGDNYPNAYHRTIKLKSIDAE